MIKKILISILVILGVIHLIDEVSTTNIDTFKVYLNNIFQIVGILSILTIVLYVTFKKGMLAFLTKIFVGKDLIESSTNFTNELPNPSKESISILLTQIFLRMTRLGILTLIVGLTPTILLYNQNKLLKYQNHRLDQQTHLQESERRSSLVFLFSNVMDAIDKELKEDYLKDSINNLSPQIIGRIVSLSKRLKPYRFLENDKLILREISPERGQLLLNLLNSNLNDETLTKIFLDADFSYADLRNSNLVRAHLTDINLEYAILDNSRMQKANLNAASLKNASLKNVRLHGAILYNCSFNKSDLTDSHISSNEFNNVDFDNATLNRSNLSTKSNEMIATFKNTKFDTLFISNNLKTYFFSELENITYDSLEIEKNSGNFIEKKFYLKKNKYNRVDGHTSDS